jgi:hypothetical protein
MLIPMQLGTFSINLNVKDIAKSRAFYEALGFTVVEGDQSQGWLVMKNGDANIGIFQGMIEKNTITFNPGWDNNGKNLTTSLSMTRTATRFFLTSTYQAITNPDQKLE